MAEHRVPPPRTPVRPERSISTDLTAVTEPESRLIDPTFLFRFEISIRRCEAAWAPKGIKLAEANRLPSFGELAGRPVFADFRLGWSERGLAVHILVTGKRTLPWCRETRLEDSDGVHLWIDTRCSPDIHRATQYCHRFLWMPGGAGPKRDRPMAAAIPIHRARENPRPIPPGQLAVAAAPRHDGYELSGFVPADALTGFSPADQPRIGLYYAVTDRELGWQTLALGPEYPVTEDPSLWAEASLA